MTDRLPLFPLGLVLTPGMLLPMHIFEERYRQLVRDLLDVPAGAPHAIGIVAIRRGWEAGDPTPDLHAIGCAAELRRVDPLPGGRFDLVTVGRRRFALRGVDTSRSYLVGAVDFLPEPLGDRDRARWLAEQVTAGLTGYLRRRGSAAPELPAEPLALSYAVVAAAPLDLPTQQALLEAPDAVSRLRAARALLGRELAILDRLGAVPAPELARVPRSVN